MSGEEVIGKKILDLLSVICHLLSVILYLYVAIITTTCLIYINDRYLSGEF